MSIAFLATGDELINGDILNSNGQRMAQMLFDAGFSLGSQAVVADDDEAIVDAIQFLLKKQDCLIITGGLGPTSDDRTRFALAKATATSLMFHEPSWTKIKKRMSRYKITVHESNRQQALFPEGADIIENPHGTADGCRLHHQGKLIFMLPGPPSECLPMFTQHVFPFLQSSQQMVPLQRFKWRLFGVSEGEIAAELDALLADTEAQTGYRWDYPYLEFKLKLATTTDPEPVISLVETTIAPHIICTTEQTATELLQETLDALTSSIVIYDHATGGLLEHRLVTATTRSKITFIHQPYEGKQKNFYYEISGLEELWQMDKLGTQTSIRVQGFQEQTPWQQKRVIPFRSKQVVDYAVEFIAFIIRRHLTATSLAP